LANDIYPLPEGLCRDALYDAIKELIEALEVVDIKPQELADLEKLYPSEVRRLGMESGLPTDKTKRCLVCAEKREEEMNNEVTGCLQRNAPLIKSSSLEIPVGNS
jgi:hypothetical protein